MKQLILGGARSGKSALAERLAKESEGKVVYIATSALIDDDPEMLERIARHRDRRPKAWALIEETFYLADAIQINQSPDNCIIVDCLTLWLSNLLLQDEGKYFEQQKAALISLLHEFQGNLILVGNEVGMGIVPMGELSRLFQDESGRLHQQLAAVCDRVILTVAGLPLVMKGKTF